MIKDLLMVLGSIILMLVWAAVCGITLEKGWQLQIDQFYGEDNND